MQQALKATEVARPGKLQFDADNLLDVIESMPHIKLPRSEVLGKSYIDLLVQGELVSSKGEARRLIKNQGAYLNGQKVVDEQLQISEDSILKQDCLIVSSGKKKILVIKLL